MTEPTKEQWFWEQCGFQYVNKLGFATFVDPEYEPIENYPPIDLNNLFKYAVPLLEKKLGYKAAYKLLIRWVTEILDGKDPATSLFKLCYKALEANDD